MKFASFDLEIAKELPDGVPDWKAYRPLGITCAAVHLSDSGEVRRWWGAPALDAGRCRQLVRDLEWMVEAEGYTLLTWNGCGFDFDVLAEESGLFGRVRALTEGSVDMMLQIVAERGHFLGLDTAAKGLGVPSKVKSVTLRDGTILDGISGAMAPRLWAAGEHEAILTYLDGDVRATTLVAEAILAQKRLPWMSSKGRAMVHEMPRLLTVAECLALPRLPRPLVEISRCTGWLSAAPAPAAVPSGIERQTDSLADERATQPTLL